MKIEEAIHIYITSQPEAKCKEMQVLHQEILALMPHCRLWFLDGKNAENKIVSNPNIGYGVHTLQYANGSSKEFYQIGMSANTTGISIYIMGIADKNYLVQTYGTTLGKASISGYCIKFKSLQDINLEVLKAAIQYGVA
jgi:hypothetical protein